MELYVCLLTACLVGLALSDDTCPRNVASISPCTCDGEGVNCMGNVNADQIKKAFRANFTYGGVRSIWIQGTPLDSVPADLFGSIKSQQFHIEVNKVTSVNMNAFKNSQSILNLLSLFGNNLQSFPFIDLRGYTKLSVFNLGKNQLRSIPDNAFTNPNLNTLILGWNQISSIGRNAFAACSSLTKLDLSYNSLTTLGPLSLANSAHPPNLQIMLMSNQISSVSSTAFDGVTPQVLFLSQNRFSGLDYNAFINMIQRMANRGGVLEVSYNPFTCKGCDYNWIVTNKAALTQMLIGFRCPDGTGVAQLTRNSIGC